MKISFSLCVCMFLLGSQLLLTTSCEYYLHDDYIVNIEPPDTIPELNISFANTDDTIHLVKPISINYSLDIQGEFTGRFKLQDKEWNVESVNGKITLAPYEFSHGYDLLTLEVVIPSNTGSIADKLNKEHFIYKKKWVVAIDDRDVPYVQLSFSDTPSGYLKISWEKADHYNLVGYKLKVSSTTSNKYRIIEGFAATETSYVDSCYIGGKIRYSVLPQIYGSENILYGLNLNTSGQDLNVEFNDNDLHKLKISCTEMRNHARYRFTYHSGHQHIIDTVKPEIIVEPPGFGNWISVEVLAYPALDTESGVYDISNNFAQYTLGEPFFGSKSNYAYSVLDNTIYTTRFDNIVGINDDSRNTVFQRYLSGINMGSMSSCQYNTRKFAYTTQYGAAVFNSPEVYTPDTVANPEWAELDHFHISDINIISTASMGKYEQYSLSTRSKMFSLNLLNYPQSTPWAKISTAQNGNYFAVVNNTGGNFYSVKGGIPQLVYNDSRNYSSCYFSPVDNLLYVSVKNSQVIEIRNPADFSLIDNIALDCTDITICNIDPNSKYLLAIDSDYLYVLNTETDEVKLKIRSDDIRPFLIKNNIYGYCGWSFNISNYL